LLVEEVNLLIGVGEGCAGAEEEGAFGFRVGLGGLYTGLALALLYVE
jgi:hypothetical protein